MTTKRARRTRDQLKEMMIDSGKQVLFESRPSLGFEHLTYTAVFDHLLKTKNEKVTIGSVHERIWKAQRDFQLDVVADVLVDAPKLIAQDAAASRAMLEASDLSTLAARRYAIQNAVRVGANALWTGESSHEVNLAHTVRFRLWALGTDHPEADGFSAAITAMRLASMQGYVDVVRTMMEIVGLRVRANAGDPDEAVETIAILGNAATIGLRTDVLPQAHRSRMMHTGTNDELEEWHLSSIAIWSAIQNTLEFADDGLSDHDRRL